jgi:uncharacterized damage-inducible protein DinB
MDMEKILKHMAWANQEVIGKIAQLPEEALAAYAVNPDWTVGTIVRHIGSASKINLDEFDLWSYQISVGE